MEHARVCARIDLDAVAANFRGMREKLNSGTQIIAVIKTDAYGHGAVRIAHLVENYDYLWGFAVATVEEAMQLRGAGISKPILILGFVFPEDYDTVVRNRIRPAVFKYSMACDLNEAARKAGVKAPVHFAVDTGMSRIGFAADDDGADQAARAASLECIYPEGLFTHFARADEADKSFSHLQYERFRRFDSMLESRGVSVGIRHVCNSAGIMELTGYQLDAVRAGITIYGIYPSAEVDPEALRLHSVMSLVSHIAYIKEVPAGCPVSYGGTFVTKRPSRIATIPAGYGDGYPRLLSNKGEVLIRGKRAPIVGRVCMDQFMVDVTDIEAHEFDTVTLMGKDGKDEITVYELSSLCGRFPYEFTCDINPRVPRVYVSAVDGHGDGAYDSMKI